MAGLAHRKVEVLNYFLGHSTSATGASAPGTVLFGVQCDGQFHMTQKHKPPRYTTRWTEIPRVKVK